MLTLVFIVIKIAIRRFEYTFDCRQISLNTLHILTEITNFATKSWGVIVLSDELTQLRFHME